MQRIILQKALKDEDDLNILRARACQAEGLVASIGEEGVFGVQQFTGNGFRLIIGSTSGKWVGTNRLKFLEVIQAVASH